MIELLLIGAGGHSRSVVDVIQEEGIYKVVGFVDKIKDLDHDKLEYSIIGKDSDLLQLRKKYDHAFITVGQIKSPQIRKIILKELKDLGFQLPKIISPFSHVSQKAKIRLGTIVMHNSIVNAYASIGENCIINSKALIEHDAIIGDNCHISTGAIINGDVQVGSGTFIGSGVVTRQSIKIGINCFIGAGVILKNDILDNQIIKK
jgi:sugar O-acyltransferase (sialic acid O-acetyltransferase NeuD family)